MSNRIRIAARLPSTSSPSPLGFIPKPRCRFGMIISDSKEKYGKKTGLNVRE
jgi:hypothetical protein